MLMAEENKMRNIRLDKVVVNIGTGNDDQKQANAKRLLEVLTGRKPADEVSRKRIPSFKISPGTKIGAYVTVREGTHELAKKLLDAVDNRIKKDSISSNTVSFGMKEYIDISGLKYDPKIGMLGMNVNLSFRRPGMRVAARKLKAGRVARSHSVITEQEIEDYLAREFKVQVVDKLE